MNVGSGINDKDVQNLREGGSGLGFDAIAKRISGHPHDSIEISHLEKLRSIMSSFEYEMRGMKGK